MIVLYGCIKKTAVYEDFIDGAFEGMKIVAELVPTLIGLFMAVRILNDSGALTIITTALKPLSSLLNTPDCVIPVIITKLFSSGSATSLMLNIFANDGPDSLPGFTSAIILSCTESLFLYNVCLSDGSKSNQIPLYNSMCPAVPRHRNSSKHTSCKHDDSMNAIYRTSTRLLAKRGRWTINYVSATNTEETKFLRVRSCDAKKTQCNGHQHACLQSGVDGR